MPQGGCSGAVRLPCLKKTRSDTEKMGSRQQPKLHRPEQAEKQKDAQPEFLLLQTGPSFCFALVSMQGTRKRFGIRFGPCIVEHKVLWCKTPQRVKLEALRLEAVCF